MDQNTEKISLSDINLAKQRDYHLKKISIDKKVDVLNLLSLNKLENFKDKNTCTDIENRMDELSEQVKVLNIDDDKLLVNKRKSILEEITKCSNLKGIHTAATAQHLATSCEVSKKSTLSHEKCAKEGEDIDGTNKVLSTENNISDGKMRKECDSKSEEDYKFREKNTVENYESEEVNEENCKSCKLTFNENFEFEDESKQNDDPKRKVIEKLYECKEIKANDSFGKDIFEENYKSENESLENHESNKVKIEKKYESDEEFEEKDDSNVVTVKEFKSDNQSAENYKSDYENDGNYESDNESENFFQDDGDGEENQIHHESDDECEKKYHFENFFAEENKISCLESKEENNSDEGSEESEEQSGVSEEESGESEEESGESEEEFGVSEEENGESEEESGESEEEFGVSEERNFNGNKSSRIDSTEREQLQELRSRGPIETYGISQKMHKQKPYDAKYKSCSFNKHVDEKASNQSGYSSLPSSSEFSHHELKAYYVDSGYHHLASCPGQCLNLIGETGNEDAINEKLGEIKWPSVLEQLSEPTYINSVETFSNLGKSFPPEVTSLCEELNVLNFYNFSRKECFENDENFFNTDLLIEPDLKRHEPQENFDRFGAVQSSTTLNDIEHCSKSNLNKNSESNTVRLIKDIWNGDFLPLFDDEHTLRNVAELCSKISVGNVSGENTVNHTEMSDACLMKNSEWNSGKRYDNYEVVPSTNLDQSASFGTPNITRKISYIARQDRISSEQSAENLSDINNSMDKLNCTSGTPIKPSNPTVTSKKQVKKKRNGTAKKVTNLQENAFRSLRCQETDGRAKVELRKYLDNEKLHLEYRKYYRKTLNSGKDGDIIYATDTKGADGKLLNLTNLHAAVISSNLEEIFAIVEIQKQYGRTFADINRIDATGKTALDYAVYKVVEDYLEENTAKHGIVI